ncbi:ANTAR domain-containing response regulator [Alteribacter populi]|uniref:ANTAR domain-containing response regulator n=1 Tax=Alteribacter populi TaxID=2011011 RepID=UPI000BBB04F8|nr:ANTAR domain-containing protein [Alteribacter populi]
MREIYLFMHDNNLKKELAQKLQQLGYRVNCPNDQEYSFNLDSHLCIADSHYLMHHSLHCPYVILYTDIINDQALDLIKKHSCTGFIGLDYCHISLQSVIEVASFKIKQLEKVHKENRKLTRKLQDRRIIEKAKYLLVKRSRISEEEAYERMRSEAMNQQKTLRSIADLILINEE